MAGRQCAICHSTSAQLGHAHGWRTLPASASLAAVRTAMSTLFPNVATLQARSHLCASGNCLYSSWCAFERSSDPVKCKLARLKLLLLLSPRDGCSFTPAPFNTGSSTSPSIWSILSVTHGSICDTSSATEIVGGLFRDYIIHLAAPFTDKYFVRAGTT